MLEKIMNEIVAKTRDVFAGAHKPIEKKISVVARPEKVVGAQVSGELMIDPELVASTQDRQEMHLATVAGFCQFSVEYLLKKRKRKIEAVATFTESVPPVVIIDLTGEMAAQLADQYAEYVDNGEIIFVTANVTKKVSNSQHSSRVQEVAVPLNRLAQQKVSDGQGNSWSLAGLASLIYEKNIFSEVRKSKQVVETFDTLLSQHGVLLSNDLPSEYETKSLQRQIITQRKWRANEGSAKLMTAYEIALAHQLRNVLQRLKINTQNQLYRSVVPAGLSAEAIADFISKIEQKMSEVDALLAMDRIAQSVPASVREKLLFDE